MEHAVFFDGTSYFVDSVNLEIDEDTKIIKKFYDADKAFDHAENLNNKDKCKPLGTWDKISSYYP